MEKLQEIFLWVSLSVQLCMDGECQRLEESGTCHAVEQVRLGRTSQSDGIDASRLVQKTVVGSATTT